MNPAIRAGRIRSTKRAIHCIVKKMNFSPAMRNGVPKSSTATLPIQFGLNEGDLAEKVPQPDLTSLPEDIAAAHDKCLPAGLRAGGNVRLALTIGTTGRVIGVRTAVSSGSEEVDLVAVCVARTLRYTPVRFRGERVEMSMVQLTVRVTPRNHERPAATD